MKIVSLFSVSELNCELESLRQLLRGIYPKHSEEEITLMWSQLLQILDPYLVNANTNDADFDSSWDSSSVVLITYPDTIYRKGESTLKTLKEFLDKKLGDLSSIVHILPFLPSTSDGGFAVSDHEKIDEIFGTWDDLKGLSVKHIIMADLVLNHVSSSHLWVQQFINCIQPGSSYIVSSNQSNIWKNVIRPRSSSLFTSIKTKDGIKDVWTTFGPDQIDVNWRNPNILLEYLRLLVRYVECGAFWIRLDAIAFIWKEANTTCLHMDEVHKIVRVLNRCLKLIKSSGVLITETNVPEKENLSYLVEGDEANIAYNFTLPPLLLESIYTSQADLLNDWLSNWTELPENTSLLNFTSSHDGIGLRALEGIMDNTRIHNLLVESEKRGGLISHRKMTNGKDQPYELNISWWSAMSNIKDCSPSLQFDRFYLSQIFILSLKGIPAFYLPAILASSNDIETFSRTGQRRDLNREKFEANRLAEILKNFESSASKNISYLNHAIKVRSKLMAFHPESPMKCLSTKIKDHIIIQRGLDLEKVYAMYNMTDKDLKIPLFDELDIDSMNRNCQFLDNLTGTIYKSINFILKPYQVVWLTLID